MATYKLIGSRYLRMFTADHSTPVYAAETDAGNIVDSLCDVPWEKVNVKDATMTSHSTENQTRGEVTKSGLDWNVYDRQSFDAAIWCANHTGGNHIAYANAACYVYELPTMQSYPNLISVKVKATSDPYNVSGLRIAVKTSDTLTIPTVCSECRTGDFYAEDVAPHKVVTESGTTSWYPKTEDKTLTPSSAVALKKYLFVFVLKEDFGETRGNWLEGSGFIKNLVEITTSAGVTGWTDGDTKDCRTVDATVSFDVCRDGIVPDTNGATSAVVYVNCLASGTRPVQDQNNYVTNMNQVNDELAPDNSLMGVRTAYAVLNSGNAKIGDASHCHVNNKRIGCGFCVRQGTDIALRGSAEGATALPRTISLTASSICIPFSIPKGFSANKIRIGFPCDEITRISEVDNTNYSSKDKSITFGSGCYFHTCGSKVYESSTSGRSWDPISGFTKNYGNEYHRLAFGNGTLMDIQPVNSYGAVKTNVSVLLFGAIGWTYRSDIGSVSCSHVAYFNGAFRVFYGENALASKYSTDNGITWTEAGSTTLITGNDVLCVCSGDPYLFVFYKKNGVCGVLKSSDGEFWSVFDINPSIDPESVVQIGSDLIMVKDGRYQICNINTLELSEVIGTNILPGFHIASNGSDVIGVSRDKYAVKMFVPKMDSSSKVNVWICDGFVDSLSDGILKNPSIYTADKLSVDSWNLVGIIDRLDETVTLDLPELKSKNVSVLLTAYIDQDDLDVSTSSFTYGTSNFFYNGISANADAANRLTKGSDLIIPSITLLG